MSKTDPLDGVDAELIQRLAAVRLVALDVDGTLTDGRVVYSDAGEEQRFDVHDGQGLAWLVRAGIAVVWITGRGCAATERRAAELGARLYSRAGGKRARLTELQGELGLGAPDTLAMGDDIPDLGLAAAAGVFVAPSNAAGEVRLHADWVTRAAGGHGAVREVCERILAAQGRWDAIVSAALE
ncbi:MAG: phenylphosphate carboxylase subunit delta [bacterium]|nr:phenylphosphate carboxylase subunit delta [bacterium]